MSEPQPTYVVTASAQPVTVICTDDPPNVREYLVNLRRDLLRKVGDLDKLIARMPQDKPHA